MQEKPQANIDYLIFTIGGRKLAIDVTHIITTIDTPPITKVPSANANILGLVNYKGRIITALDLNRIIFSNTCDTLRESAVIINHRDILYCCFVNSVLEIKTVDAKFICKCPENLAKQVNSTSEKIITTPDETIIIISPDALTREINNKA